MGTRANVDIITSKEVYHFSIYRDAFPSEIVFNLSYDETNLEDVKRQLSLRDNTESFPDYYYSISLVNLTIEIFDVDLSSTEWKRGEVIFSGTFAEAKKQLLM